jgi:conjugative transfer signal peptidase TraF
MSVQSTTEIQIYRRRLAVTAAIGIVLIAAGHQQHAFAVWNASPSVPIGLYRVVHQPAIKGQLAVIKLPTAMAMLADERGYLRGRNYLLKPIIGTTGDRTCRNGTAVTVNARVVGAARSNDDAGRALPRWRGCRHLRNDEIFVLATRFGSFDGRYFGPLNIDTVVGRAIPIWTRQQ